MLHLQAMNYIVIFKDGTAFYVDNLYSSGDWDSDLMYCAICGGRITFDGDNWQDLEYHV